MASSIRNVDVDEIEHISRSDLNEARLTTLQDGCDDFEDLLNSASEPIRLSGTEPPYEVDDGRHRMYLARDKGLYWVPAVFVDLEDDDLDD